MASDSRASATQASLFDLTGYYLKDGGFVDWARGNLENSDPANSLREAYREILRLVDQRFGVFEQAFVAAYHRWFAEGSPASAMLPIEDVLSEFVGPAAREHPVLLLVLTSWRRVTRWRSLGESTLSNPCANCSTRRGMPDGWSWSPVTMGTFSTGIHANWEVMILMQATDTERHAELSMKGKWSSRGDEHRKRWEDRGLFA